MPSMRARLVGRAAIFGGIIDGAGGDDAPWPSISRGIRSHGADRAGIGERNGGALEIGGREFAGAGARHQVVERGDVFARKSSAPAFLMLGTIRLRAPSLPATSTAMPRLICWRTTRKGWPSRSA